MDFSGNEALSRLSLIDLDEISASGVFAVAYNPIFRISITTENSPRTLFDISEGNRGTIYLHLKGSGTQYRPPGLGPGPLLDLMPLRKSQKYSIHASKDSAKNINFIHHTLQLDNGSELHSRHVTRAIKTANLFAFLYCRRCPDLRLPKYVSQDEISFQSLGQYDPNAFTLIYGVAASSKDREFSFSVPNYVNVFQKSFGGIRLTVLWTFLALPSNPSSLTCHVATIKPQTEDEELDKGCSEAEYVEQFERQCQILEGELVPFYAENYTLIPRQLIQNTASRFFADGQAISDATLKYIEYLRSGTASA